MSQILLPPSVVLTVNGQTTNNGVADFMITSHIDLKIFEDIAPVQIIGNKLQVNQKLLQEGKIYSIKHKEQEYFIRKHGSATEIFQLS